MFGAKNAPNMGTPGRLRSFDLELADVNVEAGAGEQGFEREQVGAAGADFAVTVDADLAFGVFAAVGGSVEEALGVGDGSGFMCRTGRQAFGGVGADELGPVAREEFGVGEEIGPDDLAAHGDDDSNSVFLTEGGERLLAGLHEAGSLLIDFGADGLVLHRLGVAGGAEAGATAHDAAVHRQIGDGAVGDGDGLGGNGDGLGPAGDRRRRSSRLGGGCSHCGDGAVDGIPDLLLTLGDHCLLTDLGLDHEAADCAAAGCAELAGAFGPAAVFDAEDGEVDGVGSGGNDAVLGDNAVLLAAGDDLAGEQEQRAVGVVDQDQGVDLVALLARRGGRAAAGTDETAHFAGFGDLDFAGLEALIEGEELAALRGSAVRANHGKESEVAAFDRFEDTIAAGGCGIWSGVGTGSGHALDSSRELTGDEESREDYCQTDCELNPSCLAHRCLREAARSRLPLLREERAAENFLQTPFACGESAGSSKSSTNVASPPKEYAGAIFPGRKMASMPEALGAATLALV